MKTYSHHLWTTLLFLFCALCFSACSEKQPHTSETQVIANIGDSELTVSEFNAALEEDNENPNAAQKDYKLTLLDNLIERELLANEAFKQKLHRSPEGVQKLEIARKKLFANLYIEKLLANQPIVSQSDITQYQQKNPFLFAQHKVFEAESLILNQNLSLRVVDKLSQQSLRYSDIKTILSDEQINFQIEKKSFASETLPDKFLLNGKVPQSGDYIIGFSGRKLAITGLINITEQPLGAQEANQMATQRLEDERKEKVMKDEINRLKLIHGVNINSAIVN